MKIVHVVKNTLGVTDWLFALKDVNKKGWEFEEKKLSSTVNMFAFFNSNLNTSETIAQFLKTLSTWAQAQELGKPFCKNSINENQVHKLKPNHVISLKQDLKKNQTYTHMMRLSYEYFLQSIY